MIRLSSRNGRIFALCLTAVAVGSAFVKAAGGANPRTDTRAPARPLLVLQRGHRAGIKLLAFSPDSHLLATCDDEGTVQVRQAATGDVLSSFSNSSGYTEVLAFASDNRTLMTDGALVPPNLYNLDLHDAYTGYIVRSIPVDGGHVAALPMNGLPLAYYGSGEGYIVLYDWRAGHRMRSFKPLHVNNRLSRIVFSANGRILACVLNDFNNSPAVEVWDVQTGRPIHTFEPPKGESIGSAGDSIALSPDGRLLAQSGGLDPPKGSPVYLWDVESGKRLRTFRGNEMFNASLSFSSDGTRLNVGGMRSGIKTYDVKTGELKSALPENVRSRINGFSPDGRLEADTDSEGALWISDVRTGRTLWSVPGDVHEIAKVVWPAHGDTLITTGGGRNQRPTEVARWDTRTGACIGTQVYAIPPIWELSTAPDGRPLIAVCSESPFYHSPFSIWNLQTRQRIGTFHDEKEIVTAVAVSPDGHTLAIGGWPRLDTSSRSGFRTGPVRREPIPGMIDLWDLRTWKKLRTFSGVQGMVTGLEFSPDGRTLYSAGGDSAVTAWNPATGNVLRKFAPGQHGQDGLARIFDLSAVRQVRVLKGDDRILSAAFSPHGEALATVDRAGTFKWWDAHTGKLKAQSALFGPGNGKVSDWITYTPEGSYAGSDGVENYIRWCEGNTTLPAARFHAMNRPDRVQIALTGAPQPARFAELMRSDRERRRTQAQERPITTPLSSGASLADEALSELLGTFSDLRTEEDGKKMAIGVKAQLAAGADPKKQICWGLNAMMALAWVGDLAAVQGLVVRSVDVNIHDKYGGTALLYAARKGHEDVVRYLLAHDADLKDEYGASLLKLKGDRAALTNAMMGMLTEPTSDSPPADKVGERFDAEGTIAILIEWGADVNARGPTGYTPLMMTQEPSLIRTLLEHGADPNVHNEGGNTVFSILLPMMDTGNGREVLDLLLHHGLDVNAADKNGQTPLTTAIFQGRMVMARRLLDAGADPNTIVKAGGDTTLMWTLSEGHRDMAQLLIDHGAKVNTQNSVTGCSALTYAVIRGDAETVRLLLAHGADVNVRDSRGKSLLQIATDANANAGDKFGVLALLKQAGARE